MTADRIHQLLKAVPEHLLSQFWFGGKIKEPSPYTGLDADCSRFALVYSDPAFGWKFARIVADFNLPFPAQVEGDDEILYRAWLYRLNPRRYRDQNVIRALELTSPAMSNIAFKLRALLVPRDSTIERVAAITGLEPQLIRTYELLFFNILDRKSDAVYLNQLVYPRGRMEEYFEGYLQSSSFEQLLRRAGVTNGLSDVSFLAGFNNDLVESITSADSAKQLEARLMANGFILARNGWVNQTQNVAALDHSRQLIAAGKIGGDQSSSTASEIAYMADVMWGEITAFKRAEMERATKLRDGLDVSGIVVAEPRTFAQVESAQMRDVSPK